MLLRTLIWVITNFGFTIAFFVMKYYQFIGSNKNTSFQFFIASISYLDIVGVAIVIVILTIVQAAASKLFTNTCEIDEEASRAIGNNIPTELGVDCSTFKRNYNSILNNVKKSKSIKISIDGKLMYDDFVFTKYRKRRAAKFLIFLFVCCYSLLVAVVILACIYDAGKIFSLTTLLLLVVFSILGYYFEVI